MCLLWKKLNGLFGQSDSKWNDVYKALITELMTLPACIPQGYTQYLYKHETTTTVTV